MDMKLNYLFISGQCRSSVAAEVHAIFDPAVFDLAVFDPAVFDPAVFDPAEVAGHSAAEPFAVHH
jgi:hypothetical protein